MRAATFPSRRGEEPEGSDQDDRGDAGEQSVFRTPPASRRAKRGHSSIQKLKSRNNFKLLSIKLTPRSQNHSSETCVSPSPAAGRRRGRKGSREEMPVMRQQRLFVVMFCLVTTLAWVQILTFIAHRPRDQLSSASQVVTSTAGTMLSVTGRTDNRRMTSGGYNQPALRGERQRGFGTRDRDIDRSGIAGRDAEFLGSLDQPGYAGNPARLSVMSPRAFEMVAADMGDLKDMVRSQLSVSFQTQYLLFPFPPTGTQGFQRIPYGTEARNVVIW